MIGALMILGQTVISATGVAGPTDATNDSVFEIVVPMALHALAPLFQDPLYLQVWEPHADRLFATGAVSLAIGDDTWTAVRGGWLRAESDPVAGVFVQLIDSGPGHSIIRLTALEDVPDGLWLLWRSAVCAVRRRYTYGSTGRMSGCPTRPAPPETVTSNRKTIP